MDDCDVVKYGALLHDIGKFWERGSPSSTELYTNVIGAKPKYGHALWSANFIELLAENGWDYDERLKDAVLFHHDEPQTLLQYLIILGDWLSSSERLEDEALEPRHRASQNLLSIFYNLLGGGAQGGKYVLLKPLTLSKAILPSMEEGANTSAYRRHWGGFTQELKKLSPNAFEALSSLLWKYGWSIPAETATRVGRYVPDVSLYDHLKVSCAISSALFRQGLTVEDAKRLYLALKGGSDTPEELIREKLLLLIKGDLSGVQDFIYTITSKGALKTLKGRSLFLEILNEVIARHILDELELPITNLLYSGGGNFYLLTHAEAEFRSKEIRREINRALLDHFKGKIALAMDWIKLTPRDFRREEFATKWDRVGEKVERGKERRFSSLGLKEGFKGIFGPYEEGGRAEDTCDICKAEVGEAELEVIDEERGVKGCKLCRSFRELAHGLKEANYLVLERAQPGEGQGYNRILREFGYRLSLERERREPINGIAFRINDTSEFPFKFIPMGIPMENGEIIGLSELAEKAEGPKKLAVLRMDVDDLGKIFREGLGKESTISRVSTLSSYLSIFFEGYINTVLETSDYENSIYTVYSGGDDAFFIGPWDQVFELAYDIYESFRNFTCLNPNVTVSAGLTIVEPKFPVHKGAELAGAALKDAKAGPKNRLSLLGVPFHWEPFERERGWEGLKGFSIEDGLSEFATIYYLKDLLVGLIKKQGESRSILQRIGDSMGELEDVVEQARQGKIEVPRLWRLKYYLYRWLRRKELRPQVEVIEGAYKQLALHNFLAASKGSRGAIDHRVVAAAARWAEFLTRREG